MTLSYSIPKGTPVDNLVTIVGLQPLALEKGDRQYVLMDMRVNPIKGKMDTPGGIYGIHVKNMTLQGENKLRFEPVEPLQPGEYAFVVSDSDPYGAVTYRMYCFGVD
jgi:hypothetical protein